MNTTGNTVVLYGNSGLGKTTAIYHFIKELVRRTGRQVRCVSFEDSSKLVFAPLIAEGSMDYLSVNSVTDPLAVMAYVREGNWPVMGADGKLTWQHPEAWVGQVSAYVFEGLTTMSETLMETCRQGHRFLREQASDAFESSGRKFTASSKTSYGFVQMEALTALQRASGLPVEWVIWSAHEAVGSDEDLGGVIRGPGLVGKAKTARVQAYVGTMLHLDKLHGETRMFFTPHPDPTIPGVQYPAKVTLPPEAAAKLHAAIPSGSLPVTITGTQFSDFLFKLRELSASAEAASSQPEAA